MSAEEKVKTILIVDDEREILRLLERLITREGYRALTASSAIDAFMHVQENKVDLVISDIRMPGMDGLELIGQIHDLDPTIPAIVISGYGTFETVIDAVKRGAFFFLNKPFESHDLLEAVKKGLRLHHLTHEPGDPPPGTRLSLKFEVEPDQDYISQMNYQISIAAHSMGFPYSIYSVNLPFIADELIVMAEKAAAGKEGDKKLSVKVELTKDAAYLTVESPFPVYDSSKLPKSEADFDVANIESVSLMMATYFAESLVFSEDMKKAEAVITKSRAVYKTDVIS
ncbi:MAG: response regulator [Nitrospinae bacterium]|nr:response regulator [Nitrospinota bacterium]